MLNLERGDDMSREPAPGVSQRGRRVARVSANEVQP